jgi:hypothetical protein
MGEVGAAVQLLQAALIDLDFRMPISTRKNGGAPDGIYGPETAQTMLAFQTRYDLDRDGVAGAQTLGILDDLFGEPVPAAADVIHAVRAVLNAGYHVLQLTSAPYWFWPIRPRLVQGFTALRRALVAYQGEDPGPDLHPLAALRRMGLPLTSGHGPLIGVAGVDDVVVIFILFVLLMIALLVLAARGGTVDIRQAVEALVDTMQGVNVKALDKIREDAKALAQKLQECQQNATPERQAACAQLMQEYADALRKFLQATNAAKYDPRRHPKQVWKTIDRLTEDLIDARDRVKKCLGCENF